MGEPVGHPIEGAQDMLAIRPPWQESEALSRSVPDKERGGSGGLVKGAAVTRDGSRRGGEGLRRRSVVRVCSEGREEEAITK